MFSDYHSLHLHHSHSHDIHHAIVVHATHDSSLLIYSSSQLQLQFHAVGRQLFHVIVK